MRARALRSVALLASLLLPAEALARVFVLPHLLEKSGRIENTQFTFDTTIFANYTGGIAACPPGQPCAYVQLYLFDQTTGFPLQSPGSPPVCNPCFYFLGSDPEGTPDTGRKQTIVLDDAILAKGGFADSDVVLGFGVAVIGDDFDNVSLQGFVTNSHTSAFDLSVFGFDPVPIAPSAGFASSPELFPRGAAYPSLGASRVLTDIREDQGTVATTDGAYDTSISIFYLDAWFGPAPPTGVAIEFLNDDGSPMLGANGLPYSYTIENLAVLPQPVLLDLETPLFGGVAPGAPGKRGYATVNVTGALPARVDVTSFVRKAESGPTALDPDGFYEQALEAPEPSSAAAALVACLALLARRRRALPRLGLLAVSLFAARPAAALVVPFVGTIEIELSTLVTSFGGAGFATIDDVGGDVHVSSIQFTSGAWQTTGLTISVTDPSSAPIRGIQVTAANGPGAFAENGGGTLVGAMSILGAAKVCLFGTCDGAVANLNVPLHVIGVGGRVAATGPVNVTVEGAPWTTATAVNFFPFTPFITTRMGTRHGPASLTSSTAAPGGTIQLVTPYTVWTNLGVDQPSVFGFVRTTLHFVPEPTPLALLAGGCVWLGMRARRRTLTT